MQKNVDLLRLLYPVIIAISVIVLALGNIFVILMAEKEAAIMRILGTPHKSIGVLIGIRQFILNVYRYRVWHWCCCFDDRRTLCNAKDIVMRRTLFNHQYCINLLVQSSQ